MGGHQASIQRSPRGVRAPLHRLHTKQRYQEKIKDDAPSLGSRCPTCCASCNEVLTRTPSITIRPRRSTASAQKSVWLRAGASWRAIARMHFAAHAYTPRRSRGASRINATSVSRYVHTVIGDCPSSVADKVLSTAAHTQGWQLASTAAGAWHRAWLSSCSHGTVPSAQRACTRAHP